MKWFTGFREWLAADLIEDHCEKARENERQRIEAILGIDCRTDEEIAASVNSADSIEALLRITARRNMNTRRIHDELERLLVVPEGAAYPMIAPCDSSFISTLIPEKINSGGFTNDQLDDLFDRSRPHDDS